MSAMCKVEGRYLTTDVQSNIYMLENRGYNVHVGRRFSVFLPMTLFNLSYIILIVKTFSMNKYQIKQITPNDSNFLAPLNDIDQPARRLWYIGELPERRPTVAIVGSRKPTDYGRAVSTQIVGELARRGVIIVSGLAVGHDGLAHRVCLDAGGTTVAVIGNGLNDIYPHRNQGLAEDILKSGGAIISEYPPEQPVLKHQFLERNRLISGLADIVVVIEAGERSGTLNTASHALSQGREVMAVPGNITSPLSIGCNKLIADGAAPVLSAQDIIDRLGIQDTSESPSRTIRFDSPDAQKIYDLVLAGEHDGDRLIEHTGLSAPEFTMAVSMLELNGYITALGGNQWVAR